MPGSASHTHGYGVDGAHARGEQALIAGVLVRAEADFEFGVEARLAVDDDAPDAVDATGAALRPVRREVVGHPVDVLDGDHLPAVDDADAFRVRGADGAGFDDAAGGFEPSRRRQELAFFPDLVELDPQCIGDHGHRGAPAPRQHARAFQAALVVQRLAESEQLAHVELDRVSRVVGDLDAADGVHLVRHRHERDREEVAAESWFNARGEDRTRTGLRRLANRVEIAFRQRPSVVDQAGQRRGDDVLARGQDATEVGQRLFRSRAGRSRVDDTVRVAVQNGRLVAAGAHADRRDPGQRADVLVVLARRMHPGAHQLEIRPVDDRTDREPPDAAGRPHRHLVRLHAQTIEHSMFCRSGFRERPPTPTPCSR